MSYALIRVSALVVCLLSVSPLARAFAAEQAPLDLSKPFLLIQTTDSDQLAAGLEQASAAGYHVVCASSAAGKERVLWHSGGLAVVLEKSSDPGAAHAYRVVRMPPGGLPPKRFHEVLDGPGAEGFRFVPALAIPKESFGRLPRIGMQSQVLLLERAPSETRRFTYRVGLELGAKAMCKHIAEGEEAGFKVAAMLALPGYLTLIMERDSADVSAPVSPVPQDRYLYLDTVSDGTLRDRVRKAAAEGYRVKDASRHSLRGGARSVLLEKVASLEAPYSYEFVDGQEAAAVDSAMNEAGSRGYRLHPRAMALGLLMLEKAPGAPTAYSYRLLTPDSAAELESGLAKAAGDGYSIAGMENPGTVVLEKPGAPAGR